MYLYQSLASRACICACYSKLGHVVHQCCDQLQVPREAAEEAKDAVVATAATAGADAGAGLDMFADNVDADMFAETPKAAASAAPAKKALLDNYDDAEG